LQSTRPKTNESGGIGTDAEERGVPLAKSVQVRPCSARLLFTTLPLLPRRESCGTAAHRCKTQKKDAPLQIPAAIFETYKAYSGDRKSVTFGPTLQTLLLVEAVMRNRCCLNLSQANICARSRRNAFSWLHMRPVIDLKERSNWLLKAFGCHVESTLEIRRGQRMQRF
ncbi:hypothetical protein XENOCAPTIV_022999, partial [Xenoophorus captivus]